MVATTEIRVRQITTAIGAEIEGIDLRAPLSAAQHAVILQAFRDHLVVVFREQELDDDDLRRFGSYFGRVSPTIFSTTQSRSDEVMVLDFTEGPKGKGSDVWHSDHTFMAQPPLALVLRAAEVPSVGGDTCFASMYAAFEALSPPMQALAEQLSAVHTIAMSTERHKGLDHLKRPDEADWPPVEHPVVRRHPQTGRKYLFVNRNWTQRIVGVTDQENEVLLPFFFNHVQNPEFQFRLHWERGTVAFIENRAALHYGIPDYVERRVLQRMMVLDEPPTLQPA